MSNGDVGSRREDFPRKEERLQLRPSRDGDLGVEEGDDDVVNSLVDGEAGDEGGGVREVGDDLNEEVVREGVNGCELGNDDST